MVGGDLGVWIRWADVVRYALVSLYWEERHKLWDQLPPLTEEDRSKRDQMVQHALSLAAQSGSDRTMAYVAATLTVAKTFALGDDADGHWKAWLELKRNVLNGTIWPEGVRPVASSIRNVFQSHWKDRPPDYVDRAGILVDAALQLPTPEHADQAIVIQTNSDTISYAFASIDEDMLAEPDWHRRISQFGSRFENANAAIVRALIFSVQMILNRAVSMDHESQLVKNMRRLLSIDAIESEVPVEDVGSFVSLATNLSLRPRIGTEALRESLLARVEHLTADIPHADSVATGVLEALTADNSANINAHALGVFAAALMSALDPGTKPDAYSRYKEEQFNIIVSAVERIAAKTRDDNPPVALQAISALGTAAFSRAKEAPRGMALYHAAQVLNLLSDAHPLLSQISAELLFAAEPLGRFSRGRPDANIGSPKPEQALDEGEQRTLLSSLRKRLDWPVSPPYKASWQRVSGRAAVAAVQAAVATGAFPRWRRAALLRCGGIRVNSPSFYPGATITEFRIGNSVASLISRRDDGVFLDGSSRIVHEANLRLGVELKTAAVVLEYLQFFCSSITTADGVFRIVETLEDIKGLDRRSSLAKKIKKTVAPVEIIRKAGKWRAKACVIYANTLVACQFGIESNGFVTMDDDHNQIEGIVVPREHYVHELRRFG